MMRVLLVSPSGAPGGAERALVSLARGLPDFGIHTSAAILQRGPLEDWMKSVACPFEVIDAGRTRELHRTVGVVSSLAQRARDVDVVVSNQSKGHVYGGLAALIARRPAVWWQHGIPERSRIELVAAKIPSALVITSGRDAFSAQERLTPRREVRLVQPGVDVGAVALRTGSGQSIRRRFGGKTHRLVGIVGRLDERKGQEVFLKAASRLVVDHPEVSFVVVGGAVLGWEGDYPQRLEALSRSLGIQDRVHFVGHQDDVYPWFDALDVVVHASMGESFGLVLVEAMALGRPLVATAAGGPVEIVEDGVSGILVAPGDDGAMARAIGSVLDDDSLRARLQAGAEDRAAAFDEGRMVQQFAGLLRGLR